MLMSHIIRHRLLTQTNQLRLKIIQERITALSWDISVLYDEMEEGLKGTEGVMKNHECSIEDMNYDLNNL